MPLSLLNDVAGQIRCDVISFEGFDSCGEVPGSPSDPRARPDHDDVVEPVHWQHYRHCQPCSYPDRIGDLRAIITIADFYTSRQWHSTGMYTDLYRPKGFEHELMLSLPYGPGRRAPGPGKTLRLFLFRGPGSDFSEADRALLTLLRPHLHQAYLDAERRRHPVPELTPRQWQLMDLLEPATPTRRSPGASAYPRAPSASTWKTSTGGSRYPAAPQRSPALSLNPFYIRAKCFLASRWL